MRDTTRRAALGGLFGLSFARAALGAETPMLSQPTGPVVLTVSGEIRHRNSGNTAVFDLPMIEALGHDGFSTKTPWTSRIHFTGVRLTALLGVVGAFGTTVDADCLNDYYVKFSAQFIAEDDPLLATRIDGALMPISRFGPLFLIVDFDAHPGWETDLVATHCPWQLSGLRVVTRRRSPSAVKTVWIGDIRGINFTRNPDRKVNACLSQAD